MVIDPSRIEGDLNINDLEKKKDPGRRRRTALKKEQQKGNQREIRLGEDDEAIGLPITKKATEEISGDENVATKLQKIDKIESEETKLDLAGKAVDQDLPKKKDGFSYSQEKLDEIELSRKGSEITLARIKDYSDLLDKSKITEVEAEDDKGNKFIGIKSNAKGKEGEEESDRIFLQKTRELWKELVVHGIFITDEKTKKPKLGQFSDLDGKSCLGLLKLAGFKFDEKKDVEYVPSGESRKGKINFDTGGKQGVIIENGGNTAYIDHHDPTKEEGKNSSATKETYKLLVSMGLLKKEAYLDDLVEFVTNEDGKLYYGTDIRKNFLNSARTVLGLNQYIPFRKLAYFFKTGGNPLKPLSGKELVDYKLRDLKIGYGKKKRSLVDISNEKADKIKVSKSELERMEKEGFIVKSDRYGKIAVDVGKKVPLNDAAVAFGCSAYIIWNPDTQSFFITTTRPLEDSFSQGRQTRERIWMKSRNDKTPLTATLNEILMKMTDNKFKPEGELKKFLEEEAKTMPKTSEKTKTAAGGSRKYVELPPEPKKSKIERKEVELTLKEKMDIEAYMEFATGYLEDIDKYLKKNFFDEKDIPAMRKGFIKRFWEHELHAEMIEDKRIREEVIPEAIEEVKKGLAKRTRHEAEAENALTE